jgi:23S rRNA pseudouridine2605 synthase
MARPLEVNSARIFKDSSRGERLQRFLADSGVASRRACEDLIREGRVTVNGIKVTDLPAFIDPANDHVVFDGRGLTRREAGPGAKVRHEYVMLYKPERTLVATRDEPGLDRRTVMELVRHPSGARLFPVGRLDYETTGLLLLTTDGELTNLLTHPRFSVAKTYEVVVKDELGEGGLHELRQALRKFEKQAAKRAASGAPAEVSPIQVEVVQQKMGKSLLRVTLKESRNREIRQMLAAAGLTVQAVERVAIGPLALTGVRLGSWRDLDKSEVKLLYKAATAATAGRAGPVLRRGQSEDGEPPRAISRRVAKAVTGASRNEQRDQRRAEGSRRPKSVETTAPEALPKQGPGPGQKGGGKTAPFKSAAVKSASQGKYQSARTGPSVASRAPASPLAPAAARAPAPGPVAKAATPKSRGPRTIAPPKGS